MQHYKRHIADEQACLHKDRYSLTLRVMATIKTGDHQTGVAGGLAQFQPGFLTLTFDQYMIDIEEVMRPITKNKEND